MGYNGLVLLFTIHKRDLVEGSLEVKLPTIWRDEKQSRAEAERRERLEERRGRRKKMQMREKVGKSRNTVFFQWFGAPEGRKVGSLKRRVRSQLARWEMKNCTPLWREAHLQVKMYKAPQLSDHFWKLRCRKSARRCGAKHICTSKCAKHIRSGPLLEVAMSKKCTPLWREAHLQVKMYKTHQVRTTFGSWDVQKVHAVVARSTFPSQNVQNTRGSRPLLEVSDVEKVHAVVARTTFRSQHVHYTRGSGPLLEVQMSLHSSTLHYRTLHYYSPVHSTTLKYTPVHSTTLHYTTPHYITLNDTAPQIDRQTD